MVLDTKECSVHIVVGIPYNTFKASYEGGAYCTIVLLSPSQCNIIFIDTHTCEILYETRFQRRFVYIRYILVFEDVILVS